MDYCFFENMMVKNLPIHQKYGDLLFTKKCGEKNAKGKKASKF